MNRLGAVDPATAQPAAKALLDGPLKGKHFNIFKSMAVGPAALQAYLGLAGAIGQSSLTAAEREVIQLAVGQANNCEYCVAAHTVIGKGSGLTQDQTIEARRGKMADAKLAGLARFALALNEKRGHVNDEDLALVRQAGYGNAQIAEAVAVFALAIYTNYFNHVNQTPNDFPAPPAIEPAGR